MNKDIEYLQKTLEMRFAMKEGEYKWDDLLKLREEYDKPTMCKDNLRKSFPLIDEMNKLGYQFIPPSNIKNNYKETSEINSNGTLSSDKLIQLNDKDRDNPESLLKAHGFNPKNFELINAKNSIWQQGKKEGAINLYSSKITVKPLKNEKIIFEDIDNYFNQKDFSKHNFITPVTYNDTKDFLEIDIADLHFGLLACEEETGDQNFDIKIAEEFFKKAIGDVIYRCQNKKFKRIVIAFLGDILHTNNAENTTSHGTPQDTDTRITKVFNKALDMLIDMVETFKLLAPIEIINITGNHDRETGYMLNKALEMAFRNDENIIFYNSPNPRKARQYGRCLIGWTHGDIKKEKMFDWMKTEFKKEYGTSTYIEEHVGHTHSIETLEKEDSGMIVRHLSNLCPASAWEHSMGFNKGKRAITSFVWNEDKGLRDIWYS